MKQESAVIVIRGPTTVGTGFTLAELILIVALLAILVGIVIPRIGFDALGKAESETAARQFSDYLKLARSLAITHASSNSAGYEVVLSPSYTSYKVIDANSLEDIKGPIDIPQGVACSGDSEFHFMPLGDLPQGSGELTLQFSKANDCTLVSVTPIGRIRVRKCGD